MFIVWVLKNAFIGVFQGIGEGKILKVFWNIFIILFVFFFIWIASISAETTMRMFR